MTTVNVNFSFDANGTRQLKASQISGLNVMTPSNGAPPVITLISPAQSMIDPAAPLIVDITDAEGIQAVIITARFLLARRHEVVFDGVFDEQYAGSSRVAISNGYRYTLRRAGGWLAGEVDLRVRAFDTDGHET